MKKSLVLIVFIAGMVFSSVGYAEDSAPGSLAIGVHGIGGEWSSGRPIARWKASDTWAFDFTPVLTVQDFNDNNSQSDTSVNMNNSTRQRLYGLNVGVVRQIRNVGGLSIGWRAEVGFQYNHIERSSEFTMPPITEPGSSNERREIIDLGFGPDLEYFVPVVPGLSIGASAQIHYQYSSDHYHSSTTAIGVVVPPSQFQDSSRQTTLTLIGELLTIRYYY